MSSYTPEPSLSGVLIVLNIILALIWVPVLDAVDDTTYLFHAIFFTNAFTAGWWIWMNTSLRRRIRQLSRHALACLQFLQTLATTIFVAFIRLLSALDFTTYLRRPAKKRVNSVALNERQAHALRLAWLISSCYEQSRGEDTHHDSLSEDARKRRAILRLYAFIANRRTARTSGDSTQDVTALSPDPSGCVDFLEDEETPAYAMTADANDDVIAALESSPRSESWTDVDPELAVDDLVHTPQASRSSFSEDVSTCGASLHLPAITHEALSSSASLSDAQRAEYAQLHRDLCTVTKERDLYRARAYELALRLDDCYTSHSQTSCALEGAERELVEVQSAITELEEERRALSVALGVVTAALRKGTASQLPTSSSPVGDNLAQNVPSTSEEEVVYPRASTTEDVADAASGPLLLPPSEDGEVEPPTPRMRTATWTTSSAVQRPKSKLEAIIHEAQQRARDARSKSAGQGAIWDAQRAASARPIFSVIHEEIKAEHGYGQGVAASPRLAGLTEAEQIIEDLRASRVAVNRSESPALAFGNTAEEPHVCVPIALELEAVAEIDEVEVAVEEAQALIPETPEPQIVLDGPNDEPPVVMVDTQSMEDVHQEKARETIVTINVPISRHPRGPPPSPFGKAVERELEAAAIYIKGKEQTWRGRSKPADVLDAPTLLANLKADPCQPYPESRLPNRVRARQATAPSPTTSHPLTMPPTVPIRVNISPSHSMVLAPNEHKRHATFCGDGPAPVPPIVTKSTSVGSPRWPSSVLGNGGIERLRASLQSYPFVPNSAFYQTAGKA
ncbi:hypothetical protein PYCCODRAFT_1465319 [Trametes coccinea BRFM310]|uniref:Uncharacterized protein n=1 Tax=Trametes coccinea (strain BRFM310) TaxID=1353009 RepID=A0A1Y2IYX8_TRAC3|nr:hypothetical protein PYCCODRAFT_1465319 [Trametes coccinea BRFM310]